MHQLVPWINAEQQQQQQHRFGCRSQSRAHAVAALTPNQRLVLPILSQYFQRPLQPTKTESGLYPEVWLTVLANVGWTSVRISARLVL